LKKSISIAVLLLFLVAGLWGGATYWFGLKAEEQYRAFLEQASRPLYLKLVNESYHARILDIESANHCRAQQSPDTAAQNQEKQLILAHDITHGPSPSLYHRMGIGNSNP